jgi:glycosyltransferase involved in cell wall biosynthesis
MSAISVGMNPKGIDVLQGEMATISVCIPTYNGGKYLRETLVSIEQQTFTDFDVVITDDRSIDDTTSIVEEFSDRLPITLVVNEQPQGLPGNWNRALEVGTGRWIKFVFQDDPIAPTCLEEMMKVAIKDRTRLVVCGREPIYSDASEWRTAEYEKYRRASSIGTVFKGMDRVTPAAMCHAVMDHGDANILGEPVTTLFDRELVDRYGSFNTSLIQVCDFEYLVRIGTNEPVSLVHSPLAFFRVHDEANTVANNSNRYFRMMTLEFMLLHREYANNPLYANLRSIAASRGVQMHQVFVSDARRALEMAKKFASHGDTTPEADWREVTTKYPDIEEALHAPDPVVERPIGDLPVYQGFRRRLQRFPRTYSVAQAVMRFLIATRNRMDMDTRNTHPTWLR